MSMLSDIRRILAWIPVTKGTESCAYLGKFAWILSYHGRGEQCVPTGLTGGPAAPLPEAHPLLCHAVNAHEPHLLFYSPLVMPLRTGTTSPPWNQDQKMKRTSLASALRHLSLPISEPRFPCHLCHNHSCPAWCSWISESLNKLI